MHAVAAAQTRVLCMLRLPCCGCCSRWTAVHAEAAVHAVAAAHTGVLCMLRVPVHTAVHAEADMHAKVAEAGMPAIAPTLRLLVAQMLKLTC